MYLGRHVVRRSAITLLPVACVLRAGQHERAVADGADGPLEGPELGHLLLEHGRGQVLAHPRCVAARQQQAVVLGGRQLRPRER